MNATAIILVFTISFCGTACDIFSQIDAHSENFTALQTISAPPWVSSTNYRGTMDILTSCIFTLLWCVYTAVHLNVLPEGTNGWLANLKMKLLWVTIALLAPDIVLYMASSQFLEALWLKKKLKACGARRSPTTGKDEEAGQGGEHDVSI